MSNSYHHGYDAGHNVGYAAGYDKGYADGMIAGDRHARMHAAAQTEHTRDMLQRAMNARVEALLRECGVPGIEHVERTDGNVIDMTGMLENAGVPVSAAGMGKIGTIYQGRNNLCASCGKPVGDSPVQKNEYGNIFLYCSTQCRDYHAVGA